MTTTAQVELRVWEMIGLLEDDRNNAGDGLDRDEIMSKLGINYQTFRKDLTGARQVLSTYQTGDAIPRPSAGSGFKYRMLVNAPVADFDEAHGAGELVAMGDIMTRLGSRRHVFKAVQVKSDGRTAVGQAAIKMARKLDFVAAEWDDMVQEFGDAFAVAVTNGTS